MTKQELRDQRDNAIREMDRCHIAVSDLAAQRDAEKARADKAEAALKNIRCIYCDTVYTVEQKEQLADHILSCAKSPLVTLCREYEGMLHLMIDEFAHVLSTGCWLSPDIREKVRGALKLFVEWRKTPDVMVSSEVIESQHEALALLGGEEAK